MMHMICSTRLRTKPPREKATARGLLVRVLLLLLLGLLAVHASAQEPPWDPSVVKPCDRSCLTGIMDAYLAAMVKHDRSGLPLERDVRMTENTAAMDVGEGILWRARVEPTSFKLYVADPVDGQVGLQTVLNIEGRPPSSQSA